MWADWSKNIDNIVYQVSISIDQNKRQGGALYFSSVLWKVKFKTIKQQKC